MLDDALNWLLRHLTVALSVALNIVLVLVLGFTLPFRSTLKRLQARRDRRRKLLLALDQHMRLFEAYYLALTASTVMDWASELLDPIRSAPVRAASGQLHAACSAPFQASLDFLRRHEFELPAGLRGCIAKLDEATRTADASAITDPVAVEARALAVRDAVADIRRQIRFLITLTP